MDMKEPSLDAGDLGSGTLFISLASGGHDWRFYVEKNFILNFASDYSDAFPSILEQVMLETPFVEKRGLFSIANPGRRKKYDAQVKSEANRRLAALSEPFYQIKSQVKKGIKGLVIDSYYSNGWNFKDGDIGELAIRDEAFLIGLKLDVFEHRKNIPYKAYERRPHNPFLDCYPEGQFGVSTIMSELEIESGIVGGLRLLGARPDAFGDLWMDAFFDAYYFSLSYQAKKL